MDDIPGIRNAYDGVDIPKGSDQELVRQNSSSVVKSK